MKEILFRAKRLDNGEWVESMTFTRCTDEQGEWMYYIGAGNPAIFAVDKHGNILAAETQGECLFYKADPKTVGQFTGLYNLAGQKIWEGDIVRLDGKTYVVQRECDTPGGYWADTGHILKRIGWSDWLSFVDTIDDYYNEICIEIIGNIHDNPELLEGEK